MIYGTSVFLLLLLLLLLLLIIIIIIIIDYVEYDRLSCITYYLCSRMTGQSLQEYKSFDTRNYCHVC
jgi:hypothetical protein